RGEVIVEAGRSAFLAEHRLPEGAGGEEPGVERLPAAAERVLLVLRGTGAVAVYGDGKSSDAKSGHTRLPGEFGSGKDDREAREMTLSGERRAGTRTIATAVLRCSSVLGER